MAGDLVVPHPANSTPTVPTPVSPSTQPAPAPPSDSPPSGSPGQVSPSGSDPSPEPWNQPGDSGIPDFPFPRPDIPPSGSRTCDLGCEEKWSNYFTAAATAAQQWADGATGAEKVHASDLAASLWDSAQSADERLGNSASDQPASPSLESIAVDAISGVGKLVPEDHGLDLGPPIDLSSNVEALALILTAGMSAVIQQQSGGTTTCPNGESPGGKVQRCTN
jgi:hypothetical protein